MTESISRKFSKLGPHVSATGTITTNAATASAWETARTLTLSGDVSGNVSIDGSENVTLTATVSGNSVTLGTDTTGDYVASITNGNYITGGNGGSEGATLTLAVDATSDNTASKVVARDASGNFSAGTITATLSGNASTATTWATGRTIALTGDVTGTSGAFDGSGNLSFATTLANSGVTEGTFTKVTVDAKGRVTTGASLASGDLPTYTGTLTSSQVTTALGYTPYNATNPNGYTTNTGTVTSVSGTGTASGLTLSGTVTTSGNLTLSGTVNSLAAGTYAISISGNAATATSATTAGALTSMNISQFTNNSGYITGLSFDGLSSKTGGTGTYTTSGDFRAPIFYDSNNTGYYADPASVSRMSGIGVGETYYSHGYPGVLQLGSTGYNYNFSNGTWSSSITVGILANCADQWEFAIHDSGERVVSPFIFYGGASNYIYMGRDLGWGTTYIEAASSFRAPIFYDSNNTTFYVDPNSKSELQSLDLGYTSGQVYNTAGQGTLFFNNHGESDIQGYSIGTTLEDYGGNYTKLTIDWHTGIKIGAYFGYGGIRFYNNSVKYYGGSKLFSIGEGDNHVRVTNVLFVDGDARAPIFYDSNNTAYYCDPNGTARLSYVVANGGIRIDGNENLYLDNNYGQSIVGVYTSTRYQGVFAMGNAYKLPIDGSGTGTLYGLAWSHPNAGGVAANLNTHGLLAMENGTWLASLTGSTRARDDMRAPIFYDNNNTGYYVDPNSSSYLYQLTLSGAVYFRPSTWIQFDSGYGLYWPNNYGGHFYPNDGSTYTQFRINGQKNSYDGIWCSYSAVNGMMYDSGGNGGVYREANGRWYFYYHLGNDCMGIGTSSTSSTYSLYLNKGVYAQSRVDATIFYDSNDTNWYCDPNSTSRFWTLSLENRLYIYGGNPGDPGSDTTPQVFFKTGGGMGLSSIETDFWTGFTGNSYPNNFQIGFRMAYDKRLYVWQDLVQYYSDERLKEKTGTLSGALDAIKAWTPFKYVDNALANSFNFGSGRTQIGLSAQEVQQYYPELVELAPFDVQNDFSDETNPRRVSKSGENYLTLNYTRLVPVLIQAIKEQQAKIEELEHRINNS